MRENYSQILGWIGLSEGGYVDHPDDPGGATDRGITQRTFDAWNKRQGKPKRSVRGISKTEADRIVEFQYLDAVRADVLPSGLDYAVSDYAVNSGPGRAVKDLQRVLGVQVDGIIGLHTLEAVENANTLEVIKDLCERRMTFLRGLRHWKTFGDGWTRRVMGDLPGAQTGDIGVIDRSWRMARGRNAIQAPKKAAPGKGVRTDKGLWALIQSIINAIFGRRD